MTDKFPSLIRFYYPGRYIFIDVYLWSVITSLLSFPLGTRRCCDVESTSLTLIQRRNNVVCPVGGYCSNRHTAVPRLALLWTRSIQFKIRTGLDIGLRGCTYRPIYSAQISSNLWSVQRCHCYSAHRRRESEGSLRRKYLKMNVIMNVIFANVWSQIK